MIRIKHYTPILSIIFLIFGILAFVAGKGQYVSDVLGILKGYCKNSGFEIFGTLGTTSCYRLADFYMIKFSYLLFGISILFFVVRTIINLCTKLSTSDKMPPPIENRTNKKDLQKAFLWALGVSFLTFILYVIPRFIPGDLFYSSVFMTVLRIFSAPFVVVLYLVNIFGNSEELAMLFGFGAPIFAPIFNLIFFTLVFYLALRLARRKGVKE